MYTVIDNISTYLKLTTVNAVLIRKNPEGV